MKTHATLLLTMACGVMAGSAGTVDAQEGIAAFLEKRDAVFKGR